MTWTPDTAIANNVPTLGFRLYGKTLTMDNYELFKTLDVLTTTYKLWNSTYADYTFVVRAFNFYGESADSNMGVLPS